MLSPHNWDQFLKIVLSLQIPAFYLLTSQLLILRTYYINYTGAYIIIKHMNQHIQTHSFSWSPLSPFRQVTYLSGIYHLEIQADSHTY